MNVLLKARSSRREEAPFSICDWQSAIGYHGWSLLTSAATGWGFALAILIASASVALAQEDQHTNTLHFRAVDIFVDSKDKPLAAYQLEFTESSGAKIVGIEGGEHAAFKEAPFYDIKAIQHERVVIGAFSTAGADKLPKGKTRVATVHVQTTGDHPLRFEVQVKAAATVEGRKISVQASAEEKQRNENKEASGQK